ncbi:MAG: serine protease, partial [Bacteroidota bacterium]
MEPFDLKPSLVRFLSPYLGTTVGTGWVLDRQAGQILSASHVVNKSIDAEGKIWLQFLAERRETLPNEQAWPIHKVSSTVNDFPKEDICLLELADVLPPSVIELPLGSRTSTQGGIKVTGLPYPNTGETMTETSIVLGEDLLDNLLPRIQLDESNIRGGFSGAPVVSIDTGHIIGFCRFTRADETGKNTGTFLVPSKLITKCLPRLKCKQAFSTRKQKVIGYAPEVTAKLEEYVYSVVSGEQPFNMYWELGSGLSLNDELDLTEEEKVALQRRTYVPLRAVGKRTETVVLEDISLDQNAIPDPDRLEATVTAEEENFGIGLGSSPAVSGEPNDLISDYREKEKKELSIYTSSTDEPISKPVDFTISGRGPESGTVEELFNRHRHLSLRAIAGSGKTTSLQYLILNRCHQLVGDFTQGRIPVLIKASEYTKSRTFRRL